MKTNRLVRALVCVAFCVLQHPSPLFSFISFTVLRFLCRARVTDPLIQLEAFCAGRGKG